MPAIAPKGPTKAETSDLRPLGPRLTRLRRILGTLLVPVPDRWLGEGNSVSRSTSNGYSSGPSDGMDCRPCEDYKQLVNYWRKALRWTPGLDSALTVMFASVMTTKIVGDQLWVKIIGPASCGKSTLCEAISVNSRYVIAKSTIRGFHSGWKSNRGEDGEAGEDHSLITQITGKTLVTKDGDTLLQSPNLKQILSEGRDLYDSVSRAHYRNAESKDYSGIRMTWILAGTSSLRTIDTSELGQRFLDCVVMEDIDDELEDDILWRIANRVDRNMAVEADGTAETHYEPELAEAMKRTGGFIDYIRPNAVELLSQVHFDPEALRLCTRLGKFVAFMRARPSNMQDEQREREFAGRLVSQHTRLGKSLTAIFGKRYVDDEVIARTRKVSLDTARGQTLRIAQYLYESKGVGCTVPSLMVRLSTKEEHVRRLVYFLKHIGVVDHAPVVSIPGVPVVRDRWVLTERLKRLYEEVVLRSGGI